MSVVVAPQAWWRVRSINGVSEEEVTKRGGGLCGLVTLTMTGVCTLVCVRDMQGTTKA